MRMYFLGGSLAMLTNALVLVIFNLKPAIGQEICVGLFFACLLVACIVFKVD